MAQSSYQIEITATDNASAKIDEVGKKLDDLRKGASNVESETAKTLSNAGKGLDNLASGAGRQAGAIDRLSGSFTNLGGAAAGAGSALRTTSVVLAGTAAALTAAAAATAGATYLAYRGLAANATEFVDSSILLRKDIDATEGQYQSLTSTMLDMAAKSGLSSSALLGVGAELGGMGAAVGDITTIVDQAITAHRALDMALGDSATKLYQTKNTWRFSNDELSKSVDIVAALDNASTASAGQIMDVMSRTSAFARENGISFANWAAITTAALESGLSPQTVGGTLQKAVTLMGSGAKDSKKFATGLKLLGLNTKEFKNLRAKDDFGALVQLIEAAAKSPRGVDALNQMFGTQQATVLMSLQGNIDKLKEFRRIAYSPDTVGTAGRNAAIVGSTTEELEKRIANQIKVFKERMGQGAAELRNLELTAWDSFLAFQMKEGALGKQADAISSMFRHVWKAASGEDTLEAATGKVKSYFDDLTTKSEMARKAFGAPAPEGGWLDSVGDKLGDIISKLSEIAGKSADPYANSKIDEFEGKSILSMEGKKKTLVDALLGEKPPIVTSPIGPRPRSLTAKEKQALALDYNRPAYTYNPEEKPVRDQNDTIPPKDAEDYFRRENNKLVKKLPKYLEKDLLRPSMDGLFNSPLFGDSDLYKRDWFGDKTNPGFLTDPRSVYGIPYAETFPMPRARPGDGPVPKATPTTPFAPSFGPPTSSFQRYQPSGGVPSGPPVMAPSPPQPTTVNVNPNVQAPVTVNPVTTINVYAQTVAGDIAGKVSGALKGASGSYSNVTSDAARRAIMNTPTGPGN